MHTGAVVFLPGREHARVGVQSLVERQQGRVDVQQPALESPHEFGRQYAHESGERYQPGTAGVHLGGESRLESGTVGKILHWDHGRRHAERRGAGQSTGLGAIGDHPDDAVAAVGALRGARDGFHVAAAAGYHHGDIEQAAHSAMCTPRVPRPTWPMTLAVSPSFASCASVKSASRGATTTTMPMPQLKVRYISADVMRPVAASHSNTGSLAQLLRSSTTSRPSGNTRGMLSVSPPPVMCAKPFTPTSCASASSDLT